MGKYGKAVAGVIKKSVLIFFGAVIAAAALDIFLVPARIAPGGVSGIAALIYTVSGGLIPVGAMIILLNIPLFIAGWVVLGKRFVLDSLIGTLAYSVAADLIARILPYINRYFDVTASGYDPTIYAIMGGALLGLGYGLIFRGGATTGGTDIAARLMQRKMGWLTLGQLLLGFDAVLLVVVGISYKSINAALFSALAVFISSKVVDFVEAGVDYAKQIYIVTNRPEEISKEIIHTLGRGVTKLEGEGMYTGNSVSVLICVVYNKQLPALRKIIDQYDRHAFISVTNAREATLVKTIPHIKKTKEEKAGRKESRRAQKVARRDGRRRAKAEKSARKASKK